LGVFTYERRADTRGTPAEVHVVEERAAGWSTD
jgi:hypothetical protein